ncbi:MAG TPA: uracil-DNA glycosylase [Spirochaetia bacterium]|nr:uracil-DNA glycosylase [Spirochaetia bacterium]
MSDINSELWELLDLTEDYLKGGYRRDHPVAPELTQAETTGSRDASLEEIAAEISVCEKCGLCSGRTKTVPGEGVVDPLVMVIGEGPGADEDRTGRPFVGRAGQYLDKWLSAIRLSRGSNAFIGNVVKCRPPGNRDPLPEESHACRPYLDRQIELIRPKAILAVGRIAAQQLLGTDAGIGKLRGGNYSYKGVPLFATYHPSGVLRNPDLRQSVWDDLRKLRSFLDEKPIGE